MFGISEVSDLAREAIIVTLMVSAPMLLTGLVVGVAISVLQAATQIQEQTLTFVPKIFAMMLAMFIFLAWMATMLVNYTVNLFERIPDIIG